MDKIDIDDLLLVNVAVLDDTLNVRAVNSDGFLFAVSVSSVNQMPLVPTSSFSCVVIVLVWTPLSSKLASQREYFLNFLDLSQASI